MWSQSTAKTLEDDVRRLSVSAAYVTLQKFSRAQSSHGVREVPKTQRDMNLERA